MLEKLKEKLQANEDALTHREPIENSSNDEIFEKSFSQLGGDSLSAMHLSFLLREHLNLEVPVKALLENPLKSIYSDMLIMTQDTHSSGDHMEVCYDWEREASMKSLLVEVMEDSQYCLDCDPPERASSVLLTGSTGFLGRFILCELLLNPQITKVFCLIQNKEGWSYLPMTIFCCC